MNGSMCRTVFLLAALTALTSRSTLAADTDPHVEDRKHLLHLMAEVEAGINEQNIDRMLAQMADDATVTWLNAEVSRGKDDIKAYYRRMVGGEGAILKKYLTKARLAAPAKFYGDVAVADGTTADEFYPWKRGVFRFNSNWSGTMSKVGDQWKLVSLHLSTNVFDNPLLDEYQEMLWYVGFGAFGAGLILMYLVMHFARRSSAA
jgi:ketosteroid isomerase-like protein